MPNRTHPKQNHLLASLPDDVFGRWLPLLEPVDLPLGPVLYEAGATLSHVYFPTTCIVSLLYVLQDGGSAEIAVVGFESLVGISLFMGGESTPNRGVVQSAGRGVRLKASTLKTEFNLQPVFHKSSSRTCWGCAGRASPKVRSSSRRLN